MKKLLLLFPISIIVSCVQPKTPIQNIQSINGQRINITNLSKEVFHGLNKVVIDDTTTILIYRGVESCTMIQIK